MTLERGICCTQGSWTALAPGKVQDTIDDRARRWQITAGKDRGEQSR